MNKHKLKVLFAGLVVLSMGCLAEKAQAASTDTITLSLTPSTTFAVTLTSVTAGVGYQFGSVNLNATTLSTAAIIVTNTGSIYEYFALAVTNTSGGWTATSVPATTDTFRLSGLLNNTTQPLQGNGSFTALTNVPPANGNGNYGQSAKTGPNETQNLWLQMETPYSINTGGTGQQTMTLSVTGQAS